METQERKQTEIEEIQEEEQEEELDTTTSNKKNKTWFKWVGPTVRKATIASVAALAAPVVIPPVIFLTTVGGALCVPFGVYLGTVALTDKFMSYIFPAKLGFDEESLSFEFQDEDGESEDYQVAVYTEEEAERQIEIIRAIIGYKATTQPSIVDELRAIVHSIGVIPPFSLKEHTSLDEISSTIHLLKALIGVK